MEFEFLTNIVIHICTAIYLPQYLEEVTQYMFAKLFFKNLLSLSILSHILSLFSFIKLASVPSPPPNYPFNAFLIPKAVDSAGLVFLTSAFFPS
jgi:hypothetical protein